MVFVVILVAILVEPFILVVVLVDFDWSLLRLTAKRIHTLFWITTKGKSLAPYRSVTCIANDGWLPGKAFDEDYDKD